MGRLQRIVVLEGAPLDFHDLEEFLHPGVGVGGSGEGWVTDRLLRSYCSKAVYKELTRGPTVGGLEVCLFRKASNTEHAEGVDHARCLWPETQVQSWR